MKSYIVLVAFAVGWMHAHAAMTIPWGGKGIHQFDNDRSNWTPTQYNTLVNKVIESGAPRATLNINVAAVFPAGGGTTPVQIGGIWYWVNGAGLAQLIGRVNDLYDEGIAITVICALWRGANQGFYYSGAPNLLGVPSNDPADDGKVYAYNMQTTTGQNLLRDLMIVVSGHPDLIGKIDRFVIGNEIQYYPSYYNFGTAMPALNEYNQVYWVANEYEKALRIANSAVKQFNTQARVFASFTHHWNERPTNGGTLTVRGRIVLNWLQSLTGSRGDFDWGIAWHPYDTIGLTGNSSSVRLAIDTPRVEMKNIEVLSFWTHDPQNKYRGTNPSSSADDQPREVILSEQGYASADQMRQAAGYAYFYQRASVTPGITEMDWIPFSDRSDLANMSLLTSSLTAKPSFTTMKAAGTTNWYSVFESQGLRSYLGSPSGTLPDWRELHPSVVRTLPGTSGGVNYSHRAYVKPGYSSIGGFWISGGSKQILIRGIGKGLQGIGISNALNNARITLYGTPNPIMNDSWGSNANWQQIQTVSNNLFAFSPHSTDAALLLTLAPGGYTVHLESADGLSGTSLLEVWDVDNQSGTASSRIVNFSGNSYVDSANPSITSVVVAGTGSKGLLLRAVGPTLTSWGHSGYAADPSINWVRTATGYSYRSNNDWDVNDLNLYDTQTYTNAAGAFGLQSDPDTNDDAALFVRTYPDTFSLITSVGSTEVNKRVMTEIYDVGN